MSTLCELNNFIAAIETESKNAPLIICRACGLNYNSKKISCPKCGLQHHSKPEIFAEHRPNTKLSTHKEYRWYCKECVTKGTGWYKNSSEIKGCPKCGAPTSCLRIGKVGSTGDCNHIWEQPRRRPVNIKRKTVICGNCGHTHKYLMKRPTICVSCNAEMGLPTV